MSHDSKNELLRSLPQVEEVLLHPELLKAEEELSRPVVAGIIRETLDDLRRRILHDSGPGGELVSTELKQIVENVFRSAAAIKTPSLRRAINATGVIVHTNLGRSVLPEAATKAVCEIAEGYSTLEYDPQERARGSRQTHYEELVCLLTGAEAALAVNNNAAAVLLVLTEFASGCEAIVSRGELVEIGGSFRIPDIMQLSGARMVEVGTTNKTHLSDYEKAIRADTSLLLKVHPSNYRMVGFAESVDCSALRTLADRCNAQRKTAGQVNGQVVGQVDRQMDGLAAGSLAALPTEIVVYEDLGSGALIDLESLGNQAEPTVSASLKKGCDLVSFSGDKLLGGPQAGIIVGKREYIKRLRDNPMARALRLDKLSLAALEATLRIYLDKDRALSEIPTLRMLCMPLDELYQLTTRFQQRLTESLPEDAVRLVIKDEIARAGGGSLPMCDIPSYALEISFLKGRAQACSDFLISGRERPVVTRIKNDTILCDVRTLLNEDEMIEVLNAFKEYFQELEKNA